MFNGGGEKKCHPSEADSQQTSLLKGGTQRVIFELSTVQIIIEKKRTTKNPLIMELIRKKTENKLNAQKKASIASKQRKKKKKVCTRKSTIAIM